MIYNVTYAHDSNFADMICCGYCWGKINEVEIVWFQDRWQAKPSQDIVRMMGNLSLYETSCGSPKLGVY